MKLIKACGTVLFGALLLTACSGESTDVAEEATEQVPTVSEEVTEPTQEEAPEQEQAPEEESNALDEAQFLILEKSFLAAEEYYASIEGEGSLSPEQLDELATIVEEGTAQLTNETVKEKVAQWATLVRENKLKEAGAIVDELEDL
ncbi:hypothetical protein ACIQ34_11080 [Ureibacillus sp. NPDC094379]